MITYIMINHSFEATKDITDEKSLWAEKRQGKKVETFTVVKSAINKYLTISTEGVGKSKWIENWSVIFT